MIENYAEFIAKVDEMGFLPMSKGFLPGFPSLGTITDDSKWFTGDEDTDPWQWKDRAASDKKLAFGCILGGKKGFVSKRMYPYFFAANRPFDTIEDRYADGDVSATIMELWKLFESGSVLSTSDIRGNMGVRKKEGASRVDGAVRELQRQYYITVCGNQRKISRAGMEYGWPSNTYCRVEDWAEDGWLIGTEFDDDSIDKDEAREFILDAARDICDEVDRAVIRRLLFGKR